MIKEELLKNTKQKIDEITAKYIEFKDRVSVNTKHEIKEQANQTLDQLEEMKKDIQNQYNKLVKMEKESEATWSELEKNIYSSIDSFNSAFSRAGKLFANQAFFH